MLFGQSGGRGKCAWGIFVSISDEKGSDERITYFNIYDPHNNVQLVPSID